MCARTCVLQLLMQQALTRGIHEHSAVCIFPSPVVKLGAMSSVSSPIGVYFLKATFHVSSGGGLCHINGRERRMCPDQASGSPFGPSQGSLPS